MKIGDQTLYALVITPEGVKPVFENIIPNTALSVFERYGDRKVWVPMGQNANLPSQWWTVGKNMHDVVAWLNVGDKHLPEEVQLWLELMK